MLHRLWVTKDFHFRLWQLILIMLLLAAPFSVLCVWHLSDNPSLIVVSNVKEMMYSNCHLLRALLPDYDHDFDRLIYNSEMMGLDRVFAASSTELVNSQPLCNRILSDDIKHERSSESVKTPQLRAQRSAPDYVANNDLPYMIRKNVKTVDERFHQAEVTVPLSNRTESSPNSDMRTYQWIGLQAGTLIEQIQEGEHNVRDGLNALSIELKGFDVVYPSLEMQLRASPSIQVVPIHEIVEVQEEIVPYDTIFVANATLPLDTQQVIHPGREGIIQTQYRVLYRNAPTGPLVLHRVPEHSWIVQEAIERQIEYGQLIVPKTYTADNGSQFIYWRKIRMFATSYSASAAGVSPDEPHFGYTYTGDPMRFGIVAVDPQLIRLRSNVYVPGYGYGGALDIGSAIRGRRIDLGYDDSNLVLWYKWVDVYQLWPPPPSSEIAWVLHN